MTLIEFDKPEEWPTPLREYLEKQKQRLGLTYPVNSVYLREEHSADDESLEFHIGTLLNDAELRLSHFTRLTNEELHEIRTNGMQTQSMDAHRERFERACKTAGLTRHEQESLASMSPLQREDQRSIRIGELWGIAPLSALPEEESYGMCEFLQYHGGESTYVYAMESHGHTLAKLQAISRPTIVELAAPVRAICRSKPLWNILLSRSTGNQQSWAEYVVKENCRVLGTIHPGDARWPRGFDKL